MAYNFSNFEAGVKRTKEWLSKEYSSLHTGMASPMVLDGIMVDSYGTKQPLKNTSSISVEDPKTLRVVPWDKNQMKEIEKEIQKSELGLSVAVDQTGIRVIFPPLTQENREKLAKVIKAKLEDARVSIRKEREEALRQIENSGKESGVSEDDVARNKEKLQDMVNEANKELEDIFKGKEKVVLGK